jgi:hypothetical protein
MPMHMKAPKLDKEECNHCKGAGCKMCHGGMYAEGGKVEPKEGPTLGALIGFPGADKTAPIHKAEGGEIEGEEHEDDMRGMLGKELMEALEKKDPEALMDCIEACVLSLSHKGES